MEHRPDEAVVDRIDTALARIERALARGQAELRNLEHRHDSLKASVSQAIGEIDVLISKASE
jgi:chromosome segregation ATPase